MRRSLLPLPIAALLLAACGGTPAAVAPTAVPATTVPPTTAPTEVPVTPTQEATATPAATPTAAAMSNEDIAEKLRPSTVLVLSQFAETPIEAEGMGGGTGIVYDKANGYIITNAHVVEGASAVKVAEANSNRTRSARVVGRSQCDDIAVLKVDNTEGFEEATLGESSALKPGAEVVALGYPESFDLGNDLTVTDGSVSKLAAQRDKFEDLIQTNASFTHGNSGGPLINRRGEVIGINTLIFYTASGEREPNINFSIAMSQAKPIIEELENGKNRLYVGLNLYPNLFAEYFGTEEGMAVVGVASGSPAAQAGIQATDLLLKLEGSTITTEEDVCNILRSRGDGDQLKVQVFRAATGEILEGEITIGKVGAADEKTAKLAVIGTVTGDEAAAEEPAAEEPAAEQAPAAEEPAAAEEGDLNIVLTSDFATDTGDWGTADNDDFAARVTAGHYEMELKSAQQYLTSTPQTVEDMADVAISSEVTIDGASGFGGVMTRYRETDDARSMYVCWVNNAGQFGCSKAVDNQWTVLVEPTEDAVINKNGTNRLTLVTIGNEIAFNVNDKDLAQFNDDSLAEGGAGYYAENFEQPMKVAFDNVAIAAP